MATPVGSILVSIGADTTDLVKGVSRAEGALAKVGRAAVGIGKIIASALAAAGAAIGAMALKGVQLGNELARTARIVGLTSAELGALHHAAALSEVSTEQLDKGLQRLGRTVGDADAGLKSAVQSLATLGLNADELEKLPLSEQFLKVTDAMKGLTSQSDKLRVAQQLFGKSGAELIPLLDESSDSIRSMMEESRALGLQLDAVQSRVVQDASDSLDRMKASFQGLAMQMGANFGTAIKAAAEAITSITTSITAALPHLSAMAAGIFNIRREVENLSDAQNQAEAKKNFGELIELQEELTRLQSDTSVRGGADAVEHKIEENLRRQAELRERNLELLNETVERKKAEAVAEPTRGTGGTDDESSLEELKKAADYELKLITEVAAEKERLVLQEREQNHELATTIAEERERVRVEELDAEKAWMQTLFEEREAAAQMELAQFTGHQSHLTAVSKAGALDRAEFEKKTSFEKSQSVLSDLVNMTAGVAQHSKAMFRLNKLAAIGNAVMNTAQGVTKALASYPPPLSFAMAAAQAAAGAAQISAIKSTQFQGGGSGTTPSAAATPVVNDNPVGNGSTGGQSGGTIRVEGINSNALFTGRALRELLERLQEAQKDGGRLVVA
jgi:hypothetical protein